MSVKLPLLRHEETQSTWRSTGRSERGDDLNSSSATWSSLRGLFGSIEKPALPPTSPKVYGPRNLPLQLGGLKVAMDPHLARILNPQAGQRRKGQSDAPAKPRKVKEPMVPMVPKEPRDVKRPRPLLPIAPKANKNFFERSSKMCIRVVHLRNAKVKLRISGSKGSVLAEPLESHCAECQRSSSLCRCRPRPAETQLPDAFLRTPEPQSPQQRVQSPLSRSPSLPPRSESMRKRSGSEEEKLCSSCGHVMEGGECRHCGQKRITAEMRKEMILSAKEDVRASVFNKLQEHNEVHRDELPKGLELCGFVGIRQPWVDSVCDAITKYSTLELEEFISFVRGYETLQDDFYKSTFEEADLDNSGTMEASELAEMLQKLGIEPMSHVLGELIHEVDEEGRGELKFPEFKQLMDLLMVREGFTNSEYQTYVALFNRFDAKKSGEISDDDVRLILKWLACSLPEDALHTILKDVDADMSGTINQREYLRCLRQVREYELEVVRKRMLEETDQEGLLPKERVPPLFRDLGYILANENAIVEAAEQASIGERLDLSNLWRLLLTYRLREGMCNSELRSIDAAFEAQNSLEQLEQLTLLEVPTAIRSLGYQMSFEAMQSVLRQVDVDDSGRLDKLQFRKVIRMLQDTDLQLFLQAFDEADVSNLGAITAQSATTAFHHTGLAAQSLELPHFESLLVNRDTFARTCHCHARQVRESIQRNGGWTDPEVKDLRLFFQRYDLDNNGRINKKELVQLVEDVVPEMAHDRAMRPQLLYLMRTVHDGKGLNLEDFLKLMGLFRSFKDKERLRKEQQVIKEAGFAPQEVADFRALFLNFVEESQDMSYRAFWQMINGISPLGKSLSEELEHLFKQICHPRQEADFPDFLLLMKTLLEKDFGQIRERSATRSSRRK